MKDSIDFGSMDIPKLFRKLLIPTVLGMIFSAIFIITDGIFVGKGIGSDALAAVNITAPLFLINTGVALMFGIGASVVASIHLSQGKVKVARINITQAVVVSSLLLIAYAAVILCNVEKIALLLGSSPRLLPLATEYMHWFVPFLVFSALLSSGMFFVRLDGSPNYAMVCNIIPALLNIWTGLSVYFRLQMGNVRCGLSYQPGIHRRRPDDSDLPDAAAPGTALVQSEIIIQESASHPPQHGLYVQTGIVQFPL